MVDGKTELRPPKLFPAFSRYGEVMLYAEDALDKSRVAKTYYIKRVLFDVYSDYQWVYLVED